MIINTMKRLSMLTVIIFVLCVGTNAFAQIFTDNQDPIQPSTIWILSDFDVESTSETSELLRHNIDWQIEGSRYLTRTDEKPYPLKGFVQGYSNILPKQYIKEPERMRLLAIRAAFNTKDWNVLELIPMDSNNTLYVSDDGNPRPGVYFNDPISQIGLFALGLLRNYEVYANFETEFGQMFSVRLGSLDYKGWKPLIADINIERYVNVESYLNNYYLIRLNSLSIVTNPSERVDDFVLYIDQVFYTAPAMNDSYFEGIELLVPEFKYNAGGQTNIEWQPGSDNSE